MDVHASWRNLSGCRILHVLQVQALDISVQVEVNHTSGNALLEELVNSHTQLSAVNQVVSMRGDAADFVSNLYRTDLDLDSELLKLNIKYIVEHLSLGYLSKFRMTVLVVRESHSIFLEFLRREALENAL